MVLLSTGQSWLGEGRPHCQGPSGLWGGPLTAGQGGCRRGVSSCEPRSQLEHEGGSGCDAEKVGPSSCWREVPPPHPYPPASPSPQATSLPFLGLDDTGASGPLTASGTRCWALTFEDQSSLSVPQLLVSLFPSPRCAGRGRRAEPLEEALGLAGVLLPGSGGAPRSRLSRGCPAPAWPPHPSPTAPGASQT